MKEKETLLRIALALERLAPVPRHNTDFSEASAYIWHPEKGFSAVKTVNRIDISLLVGIDHTRDILVENTQRFASGYNANNVLLWGARGMGKSSLIKAAHHATNENFDGKLVLVEIHREDIETLPALMNHVRSAPAIKFIVLCDDLSFDGEDTSYKSLKAALDGGIEGRPDNMLFYATSNRRHLIPREMMDNERSTAINPSEAVQEKVSLSDRFGLWLGFHNCSQDDYLEMVNRYCDYYKLPFTPEQIRAEAVEWSITRGSRSGRVAWQLVQDLAGRAGMKI